MSFSWFLPFIGIVYGSLLVLVIAWLAQRAAKSLRPGPTWGGDTGDWFTSVIGAVIGFFAVLIFSHRFTSAPMLAPFLSLVGLFAGSLAACLWLRSLSQWLHHRSRR